MTLQLTGNWSFNDPPPQKIHYITPDGTEEVNLWDSLGIRSANGQSLSHNPSSSPIRDKVSLPPHLSSYPSASPFQRSGKLWVPGAPADSAWTWFTTAAPAYPSVTWSKLYKGFITGLYSEQDDPPAPIVKAERETPAVGFRAWTVELHRKKGKESVRLRGVAHREAWPGRHTMTFRCDQKHAAPEPSCSCGLYAYHEPSGAPEYMGQAFLTDPFQVMGAVVAWGKVIEYKNGFRAQYARPIALGTPPNPSNDTQAFLNEALAERAASLLELPCVPYKNLVTYAREFGERLTG